MKSWTVILEILSIMKRIVDSNGIQRRINIQTVLVAGIQKEQIQISVDIVVFQQYQGEKLIIKEGVVEWI